MTVPLNTGPEQGNGGEGKRPVELAIVIVSYKAQAEMETCLATVDPLVRTRVADVWVVDNASPDNAAVWIADRYPWANLIRNSRNVGFAAAVNQGVTASRGTFILLLNPDVVVTPKAISALLEFLRGHPDCGIAGAQLLNRDGSRQPSVHAFPTLLRVLAECFLGHRLTRDRRNRTEPAAVDAVVGACFLIRRSVIDAIGPLDEQFFLYSEEVDWCLRARQAGWRTCLVPDAIAVHGLAQSSKDRQEEGFVAVFRGRDQYMRKHFSPVGRHVSTFGLFIGFLLRAAFWGCLAAAPGSAERRTDRRTHYRRYKAVLRWYGQGRPGPSETIPVQTNQPAAPITPSL